MATDARGHTVPAATGHPARSDLTGLALSIRDVIPVASTTARAALITALTAAGVGPTGSNPVYVHRSDARADSALEVTTDGTNWQAIPFTTGIQVYTPTLTSTGTAPSLGTGASQAGGYMLDGPWVKGYGEIVFGSASFTPGTGTYKVSLPVTLASAASSAGRVIGKGVFFDSSASLFYPLILLASTSTSATMVVPAGGLLGAATPVVPAVNDQIRFEFSAEVA